jgi:hypothetical protein
LLKERLKEVKKGFFYDGHERPDNVDYRQNVFIPAFDALRRYFVEYQVGNLELMVQKLPLPPGEFWLILTAHDEMTAQTNDADKWVWCLKGEMPIRKKGVGRGIHRSDILCSTVGHIMEAGEGLEYGKNHDGYWDGEQFIKQVRTSTVTSPSLTPAQLEEKTISAFERRHDRNIYRACFLIDNSQGHCAYVWKAGAPRSETNDSRDCRVMAGNLAW